MSNNQLNIHVCIKNIKADFNHQELKEVLWEWYKHTVNGSYNISTTREEREIITSVYERFDELIDTIYQKEFDVK